jgi:hypothetical protein
LTPVTGALVVLAAVEEEADADFDGEDVAAEDGVDDGVAVAAGEEDLAVDVTATALAD